ILTGLFYNCVANDAARHSRSLPPVVTALTKEARQNSITPGYRTGRTKMRFSARCGFILSLLECFALAQNTGFINGTVLDTQGAALPAANLILTNTATGQTRQTTSSSEGYFSFTDLPAAGYRLQVTATGFKEFTLDAITLNVGQQLTVRPTLEIGSMSEKIEETDTLGPATTSPSCA